MSPPPVISSFIVPQLHTWYCGVCDCGVHNGLGLTTLVAVHIVHAGPPKYVLLWSCARMLTNPGCIWLLTGKKESSLLLLLRMMSTTSKEQEGKLLL